MKLKDILSISGKSGLYQFISQGRNGIIVESFETKKRMAVNAATKVSSLEDIAVYTETEELPLKDVFKKLFEKEEGKQTLVNKPSNDELKAKFEEFIPEYDRERVYVSDIKKIISWYNILVEYNLIDLNEEEEAKDEKSSEAPKAAVKKKTNSIKPKK
jgi:hypothetical protein